MKTLQHIAIISLFFICAISLRADQPKVNTWEVQIERLLEIELKEGFYDQPGIGHLWGKVEVDGTRGVLICPEGGLGKAFLILRSGEVYERPATTNDAVLSYCPTITTMNPNIWNEFKMDEHWVVRKRDTLARDFQAAIEKAR